MFGMTDANPDDERLELSRMLTTKAALLFNAEELPKTRARQEAADHDVLEMLGKLKH